LDLGRAGGGQRDDGTADPAEELRAAAAASPLLQQAAPEIYRGLLDYPEHQPGDVQQAFLWVKEVANDRPVFSRGGRVVGRVGNAFFYTNRTSSDRVAGFIRGMRHELGRGMRRDALVESFDAVRARLGGG
jgi:hypothetical protein